MPEPLIDPIGPGWRVTTLGTLCESGGGDIQTGPFGSQLHASDYVPAGIPSVMPQNIGDNVIREEGIARITPTDAARLSRYLLQTSDIVYSRRGDVTRRALVQSHQEGWLCGTGCLRVRLGTSANPRFVAYYLGHPNVREWIERHAIGATMPNLNTKILSALPITCPTSTEQDAIAKVLGVLDDKISINDQIRTTCYELGDALISTTNASTEHTVTLEELSHAGELTFGDGYRTKRAEHGRPGLPILRVAEVQHGHISPKMEDLVKEIHRPAMGPKTSRAGDVVLTTKGTVGRVAIIPDGAPEFVYSPQLCYFRATPGTPLSASYLFFWFRSEDFSSQTRSLKSQTDMADYLNLGDIKSLKIKVPPARDASEFMEKISNLELTATKKHSESLVLAELRDTLLPKLMSGEIKVRDAEKAVEDAA